MRGQKRMRADAAPALSVEQRLAALAADAATVGEARAAELEAAAIDARFAPAGAENAFKTMADMESAGHTLQARARAPDRHSGAWGGGRSGATMLFEDGCGWWGALDGAGEGVSERATADLLRTLAGDGGASAARAALALATQRWARDAKPQAHAAVVAVDWGAFDKAFTAEAAPEAAARAACAFLKSANIEPVESIDLELLEYLVEDSDDAEDADDEDDEAA